MANNLIDCLTKIENVLIWQIDLYSIPCTSGATYIAKPTKRQSNTDTIPSTQEGKLLDHILPSTSTLFWVTSRKSQASSYISYFAFFNTAVLALGFLQKALLWEVIFHFSCISGILQFYDPGCWQQREPF